MSYTLEQSYFIFRIISSNLSSEICKIIFDKNISEHMWDKWLKCDMDIIKFLSALDTYNRKKIIDWGENMVLGDAKLSDRY